MIYLTPEILKNENINIIDLCPDLLEVYEALDYLTYIKLKSKSKIILEKVKY